MLFNIVVVAILAISVASDSKYFKLYKVDFLKQKIEI